MLFINIKYTERIHTLGIFYYVSVSNYLSFKQHNQGSGLFCKVLQNKAI